MSVINSMIWNQRASSKWLWRMAIVFVATALLWPLMSKSAQLLAIYADLNDERFRLAKVKSSEKKLHMRIEQYFKKEQYLLAYLNHDAETRDKQPWANWFRNEISQYGGELYSIEHVAEEKLASPIKFRRITVSFAMPESQWSAFSSLLLNRHPVLDIYALNIDSVSAEPNRLEFFLTIDIFEKSLSSNSEGGES